MTLVKVTQRRHCCSNVLCAILTNTFLLQASSTEVTAAQRAPWGPDQRVCAEVGLMLQFRFTSVETAP